MQPGSQAAELETHWNRYLCTGIHDSHHRDNKPVLSIHTNAGIYSDIQLNCISKDFIFVAVTDKFLREGKEKE